MIEINTDLRRQCPGCGLPEGSPGQLQTTKMHTGIFCLCGRWNKWLSKDELGLPTKPTTTNGIKPSIRRAVLRRDNFRCCSCGQDSTYAVLHVDHIKPVKWCREHGVPADVMNGMTNLQTLCDACNLGKGSNLES